jgi:proteasome lid subunit RPN8/RPN11
MLKITPIILDYIKAHGVISYPYEGCGLLLGQVDNGDNVVSAARPLPNVWPDEEEKRTRFRIAEDDWRDAELEAMLAGLDVIGVFHSHPDHPPIASPRDLAWAAWSGYSYLITEIRTGRPAASRSWQLQEDRSGFVEEKIIENILEIKQ